MCPHDGVKRGALSRHNGIVLTFAGWLLLAVGIAMSFVFVGWLVVVARTALAERRALRFQPALRLGERAAVVVFGARVYPDRPTAELQYRLDHAIDLWHRGATPIIVMAGGVSDGLDEVGVMIDYAIAKGVRAEAIHPARPGQNTKQQVESSLRVGAEQRLDPLIGVSSAYHSFRIESEARRLGGCIRASAQPIPHSTRERWVRILVDATATIWNRMPDAVTNRMNTGTGSLRHRLPHVLSGRLPVSALLPGTVRRGGE